MSHVPLKASFSYGDIQGEETFGTPTLQEQETG
jgi:hypothetical protein